MFINNKLSLKSKVVESFVFEDKHYVILEETPFYPESGGQLCDLGTINHVEVVNVFYRNGFIWHEVCEPITGEAICLVDNKRRKRHCLLHTAQHLLSAVFEKYGVGSNSFYMRDDYFVIDVEDVYNREQLNCFEKEINSYILANLKVVTRTYDSLFDKEFEVGHFKDNTEIRLVIIEGLDKCLCGGTHVDSLKELQYLKITKHKVLKTKTRLEVYVGNAAYDHVNHFFDSYNKIINLVKVQEIDVYPLIERKLKQNKKLTKELKKLQKKS